ncbi:M28 family peptidase [Cyclobacterium marinum]|uniref:Peptidase M28 n=1 Tax=Cyclobacterium marinum (strain ATCC 25205 / DSM 745 / LMG 13164 / NCIMB 1802) TaxID=880070 RepID=G0J894_CYCMS|nr:M28 family peptidase [Cyclobacterium marinum]AEL27874.1 peptidase M28 [Cyclobacterium marinum DSM 745]
MINIKYLLAIVFSSMFFFVSFQGIAQKVKIDGIIERAEALSHFKFLASDELKGRDPERPEIDIAAYYIANQFEKYGAIPLSSLNAYYQYVPFVASSPPTVGELKWKGSKFKHGEDLLVLGGNDLSGDFEMVVAGYGFEDDYADKNVKGKWVVVRVGAPNRLTPTELFKAGREKQALAKSKGAIGLIEMYNVPTTPWRMLVNYLNKSQLALDLDPNKHDDLPYLWMKDLKGEIIKSIASGKNEISIDIKGKKNRKIKGRNVVAVIEGTDPQLKDEYVMLSAHYDHLGITKPNAEGDSIYNGARDNAVGTAALIQAANYFGEHPPKRSILLCAWTAEEKGLLGSSYFADNPPLPLKDIVFNLNIDNGGYNDTSLVTIIGLGRSSVDHLISVAAEDYGLEAIADPSPEQGLYDRSDNVNFAKKGIPAPTFSLGFTAFDQEIGKYYHQVSDQVDNFDLDYAIKYWKTYILSAENIANNLEKPVWKSGDKYEEASNALYGIGN